MRKRWFEAIQRRGIFFGILLLGLSFAVFAHVFTLLRKEKEQPIEITLLSEHLPPEICDALQHEERFLLDGRFALYTVDLQVRPTLLRFYDGSQGCEFTVPSKKYSDCELTLQTVAARTPFGVALCGVRTVNVGMKLSFFGERTKLYGTCINIRSLEENASSVQK